MQINTCITELFDEKPKPVGLIWIDKSDMPSELHEGMIGFEPGTNAISIYIGGGWVDFVPEDIVPSINNIHDYLDEGEEGDVVFCRANDQKYIKFDGQWMIKLDSLEQC